MMKRTSWRTIFNRHKQQHQPEPAGTEGAVAVSSQPTNSTQLVTPGNGQQVVVTHSTPVTTAAYSNVDPTYAGADPADRLNQANDDRYGSVNKDEDRDDIASQSTGLQPNATNTVAASTGDDEFEEDESTVVDEGPIDDEDKDGIDDSEDDFIDANKDGIDDYEDPPVDEDKDGIPDEDDNFIDLDKDGINDEDDSFVDLDKDGKDDVTGDPDESKKESPKEENPGQGNPPNEGQPPAETPPVEQPTDPTTPDPNQPDSATVDDEDQDGIPDDEDDFIDADKDGKDDYEDNDPPEDEDKDGIPDDVDNLIDADNDGIPDDEDDFVDADKDGKDDLTGDPADSGQDDPPTTDETGQPIAYVAGDRLEHLDNWHTWDEPVHIEYGNYYVLDPNRPHPSRSDAHWYTVYKAVPGGTPPPDAGTDAPAATPPPAPDNGVVAYVAGDRLEHLDNWHTWDEPVHIEYGNYYVLDPNKQKPGRPDAHWYTVWQAVPGSSGDQQSSILSADVNQVATPITSNEPATLEHAQPISGFPTNSSYPSDGSQSVPGIAQTDGGAVIPPDPTSAVLAPQAVAQEVIQPVGQDPVVKS
jgi:hypothetical protein